jgi:cystathionine beta-lyase
MPNDHDSGDHSSADSKKLGFATRMGHVGRAGVKTHGFVNPGVHRGSTVLYPDAEARRDAGAKRFDRYMTYGTQGGPTHYALEDVVADIEGGTHCIIVGTGLAAVTVPLTAFLKNGDHCLIPDSCYGPARNFASTLMADWGIETTFYDPCVDEAGMAALIRPNTKVVYLESPGSHTFEIQDVPALARAAHARGCKVLMDNTWGIHNFQPFEHGVDVSIQALTKYVGGHSDILLGSITTNTEEDYRTVRAASSTMGHYASPDDCWLALRGVRTMAMRLKAQEAASLEVASWLEKQPQVKRVLHPALPSHPQHALYKRDFTGGCSLFGVILDPRYEQGDMFRFVNALQLYGIGASWGGFESLALPTSGFITRTAGPDDFGGPMLRLHIGLEDTKDLIADLAQGLRVLN